MGILDLDGPGSTVTCKAPIRVIASTHCLHTSRFETSVYPYVGLLFLSKKGQQVLVVSFDHLKLVSVRLCDRRLEGNALDSVCRPLQAMQCMEVRGLQGTFNFDNSALVSLNSCGMGGGGASQLAAPMRVTHR